MRAGQLRHRVTVQRATESKNTVAETVRTFATHLTRSAAIEERGGSETFAGDQEVSRRTRVFLLRGDTATRALTAKDRVVHDGVTYNISFVEPSDRGEAVRLICVEAPNP